MKLFLSFLKIGAFTFGGGYAMIPLIKEEFVVKQPLLSEEKMLEFVAIAQMAPGMIAINMATLIGRHIKGFKGSVIAVLGVSLPSLVVIMVVAELLTLLNGNTYFESGLKGVLLAVIVLLTYAIIDLSQAIRSHWYLVVYALFVLALRWTLDVSTLLLIASAFLFGTLHAYVMSKRGSI
jgi:chromate transporter